jgi:hypothetical protein
MAEINEFHKSKGSDLARDLDDKTVITESGGPPAFVSVGKHMRNRTDFDQSHKFQSEIDREFNTSKPIQIDNSSIE